MRPETSAKEEAIWRDYLTGKKHGLKRMRRMFRVLPMSPRCKMCNVPFRGAGGAVMGLVGYRRSPMNPNFCTFCSRWAESHPGGAEVSLSMLFADVRNSTPLARSLGDADFTQLINRFYVTATDTILRQDAFISRMVGDEVVALFLPGLTGAGYAAAAVEAARDLLFATGHAELEGPWLPIGAGVHTGTAYVGMWGTAHSVRDFTALGSEVSLTARLAQVAAAGEILITEETRASAEIEKEMLTSRRVDLKGWGAPIDLWSMSVSATEASAIGSA